ncbi:nucleotidyl transferase AbiEii/AbiGii toxin family protein [Flavitalea flava]
MTNWLKLTNEQRLDTLFEVNRQTNLPLQAIEKDWWVTLALKATFQTPYEPYLLFKGGTSLSKSWNLVERFSEDIDMAIDRDLLGFSGNPTNSQIKKLKRKACEFISTELRMAIEKQLLQLGVPADIYSLTAAKTIDPDKDPQQLFLRYESLLDTLPYIKSEVQIEVGSRSLKEPWSNRPIHSLIDVVYIDQSFAGPNFKVPTVEPRRTFLEKAFLLHEEFMKPVEKIRSNRMSRHLYDLDMLMDTAHGINALEDKDLYQSIIEHRSIFNRLPGVDYNTHSKQTISFLPPANVIDAWESDYNSMRETMFYGNTKPFPVIMERLKELLVRFKNSI